MTWLIFWIFIIISTLIAEIATVGLVSLWFTVGGICALICNLLKLSVVIQWVVFIVVSVLGLLLFRSFWVNKMKKEIVPTNADANIGKEVIVTEDIDNLLFKGEVKVNGQLWSAQSLDGEKIDKNAVECFKYYGVEKATVVVEK